MTSPRRSAEWLAELTQKKGYAVAPSHVRTTPHLAPLLPCAQPEPTPRPALEKPAPREAAYQGRVALTITSYRCGRICDPDNVAVKYLVDALRYCGALRDDSCAEITLTIKQERVRTRKEEGTLIEIVPEA